MASNVETNKQETKMPVTIMDPATNADRSTTVRPREDKSDALEEGETGGSIITPPHAKKQRLEDKTTAKSCSLLGSSSDTLQSILSFLSLKEALALRSTCTQLYKDNNDAFRHCTLVTCEKDKTNRYSDYTEAARHGILGITVVNNQQRLLWTTVFDNNDKLGALLSNKSFHGLGLEYFLWNLVDKAKTDNGEAVSILLKDGRCKVDSKMLDVLLRKDFTAMATALQENEYIRECVQLCAMCNSNPGAYRCHRWECVALDDENPNSDDDSYYAMPPKYCRPCALSSKGKFCKYCKEFLCPACVGANKGDFCGDCKGNVCGDENCWCQLSKCQSCGRKKCADCINAKGEEWYGEEGCWDPSFGEYPTAFCPKCKRVWPKNDWDY